MSSSANDWMRHRVINGNLREVFRFPFGQKSMPSAWLLHWRALAVLGALLSVCCATARPINGIQQLQQNILTNNFNVSGKSEYFIKEVVLNKSFDTSSNYNSNNKNNKSNMGHQVLSEHAASELQMHHSDKIKLDKIPTAVSHENTTPSQSSSSSSSSLSSLNTSMTTTPQWTFNTLFSNNIKDDRAGIGDVVKGESIKNSVRSNNSSIKHDNATTSLSLSRADRSVHVPASNATGKRSTKRQRDLERNERSANLSHITGATRKIQLYIKNRFLQILPDGTVNGTHDDTSDYSKYFYYNFFIENLTIFFLQIWSLKNL